MQRKSLEEKLGDNRPKLGTKRDAGKSVRKWRKSRGLDETGVAEGMADDLAAIAQKKFPNALIRKNGEEVQKPKDGGRPYTPPAQDAEKVRRDLTAKYPNIDELVRQAELRRDPTYDYAEGEAYYRGREAEQNYRRLRKIQRVIQGLNESRNPTHLP